MTGKVWSTSSSVRVDTVAPRLGISSTRPSDASTLTASRNGVRVVGSRSHTEPLVAELCRCDGYTDIEPCGSVGVKCARIAEGRRDLYVHPVPYMSEWDTAAPEIILTEAGGSVTDCHGRHLHYNKPDPRQPHGILAAHPAVVFRVMPTLSRLMKGAVKP